MVKYLGELEDDDVVMFVIEHLKDHKSPAKLVEGLEPVRTIQIVTVCDLLNAVQRFWTMKLPSLQLPFGGKSFLRAWRTARAYIRSV
jgi:hypothetical protein